MGKQLKQLEKKYNIGWRDFEINELFDSLNGDFDIKACHINGNGNFVVTSGETNSGILGKSNIKSKIFEKNTITVDMFGSVFYRNFDYKMVTHARVFSLKPKSFKINDKIGLYLQSSMKYLKQIYSYSDMASFKKINKRKINLPIFNNGQIAFEYIEEFVATLEAERLVTLEAERLVTLQAYLEVTGLKDIELSPAEETMVKSIKEVDKYIQWGEFTINELFNVYPSKGYSGLNDDSILHSKGKTPYVSNQSHDNGYIGYSKLDELNEGNVITLSDTWQSEKTIFYQPNNFIGKSHLQVMRFRNENFNKFIAWFMISSFRKSILNMNYDYGTKFNRKKIKITKIMLPIENSGNVNFKLINQVMVATQKIVIKNVIQMLDDRIKATIKIINN